MTKAGRPFPPFLYAVILMASFLAGWAFMGWLAHGLFGLSYWFLAVPSTASLIIGTCAVLVGFQRWLLKAHPVLVATRPSAVRWTVQVLGAAVLVIAACVASFWFLHSQQPFLALVMGGLAVGLSQLAIKRSASRPNTQAKTTAKMR